MARYAIVTGAEQVRHNVVRFRWELREGDQEEYEILERHDHDYVPDFTVDYPTNIGRVAQEITVIARSIMQQGDVLKQFMPQIQQDAVGFVILPEES